MDEHCIQNCCRICLDVESKLVSIFEDSLIHLQVKACLPISVATNDNLPKSICANCVTQLNDFYNFQLNARCSQDWLESSIQKKAKSCTETKLVVQPLPDSEYNSDSLLEFLNNTANIEEYLNNLGKEDIPSIVNMLDKTEAHNVNKGKLLNKFPSPKKHEYQVAQNINMDIDVLDSDTEIVKEILMKEVEPKKLSIEKILTCYGCKLRCDNVQKLSKHLSVCELSLRTCVHCNLLFDSKQKMSQHLSVHSNSHDISTSNTDGKDKPVVKYHKDYIASLGYVYSCKQCGDTFNNRLMMFKHAKDHIIKSDERVCDICGHIFQGNDALLNHRKEEHEKPEKSYYRCKVCNFTSPDRKEIYSHVVKHTQVKQLNRHLCESCGQSFATQQSLIRHSQQHLSESHKCDICNKKFATKTLRDKHKLKHIELVICDKCGRNISILKLDTHLCM